MKTHLFGLIEKSPLLLPDVIAYIRAEPSGSVA